MGAGSRRAETRSRPHSLAATPEEETLISLPQQGPGEALCTSLTKPPIVGNRGVSTTLGGVIQPLLITDGRRTMYVPLRVPRRSGVHNSCILPGRHRGFIAQ